MELPHRPFYQELSFLDSPSLIKKIVVKREDVIHPVISGNKWRKLYYNLEQAKVRGNHTLLTFGGAYSSHVAAVAQAGKDHSFKTIGVIRGEEPESYSNTLLQAQKNGMKLHFMDRSTYRLKQSADVIDKLKEKHGVFYLIPEGGSNFYGTNGCIEILDEESQEFDIIACPAGTGCTAAGIALSLKKNQKLLVFPALKGNFIKEEIFKFLEEVLNDGDSVEELMSRVEVIPNYHFGGYAKISDELIDFLNLFYIKNKIKWDPIYNGKMAYGIFDMISKGKFNKNTKILLIHTGGMQGVEGIEKRYNISLYG